MPSRVILTLMRAFRLRESNIRNKIQKILDESKKYPSDLYLIKFGLAFYKIKLVSK